MQENTVGSLSALQQLVIDSESAYILGLWCADGYYWSSSVGITNVDKRLINRFEEYFGKLFPKERIKLRTYYPQGEVGHEAEKSTYPMRLAKQTAYQLYVNSRPLLRLFKQAEHEVVALPLQYLAPYFAGRFDGDGSVDKNLRNDLRIAYSNRMEAETDQNLIIKANRYKTRIYHYQRARTYILYVSRDDSMQFLNDIKMYSIKVQSLLPRRDLS